MGFATPHGPPPELHARKSRAFPQVLVNRAGYGVKQASVGRSL